MSNGRMLAVSLMVFTVLFIAVGSFWPGASAVYFAGGGGAFESPSTPEGAAGALAAAIKIRDWPGAYASLANKGTFSEQDFQHDLTGYALSLRTYATLESFEVQPLHQSADAAEVSIRLHWSSVVGTFDDTRDLHLVRNSGKWAVVWPLVAGQHVPPQVIPVNYLRWDVIYRGAGDEWGTQDVQGPRVRIVDMHPANRADGVVVMGELLNEDVVPAFVSVRATLLRKNGSVIESADSYDMISHTLLPKQVTPYLIQFPDVDLSEVGSIRMQPVSSLVSASADPVVAVENQSLHLAPEGVLTGELNNQSGQTVNVAHVLSTFYDKNGQVVWVAGQYMDRALLPQTPAGFRIPLPADLARGIVSQRTIVATYTSTGAGR